MSEKIFNVFISYIHDSAIKDNTVYTSAPDEADNLIAKKIADFFQSYDVPQEIAKFIKYDKVTINPYIDHYLQNENFEEKLLEKIYTSDYFIQVESIRHDKHAWLKYEFDFFIYSKSKYPEGVSDLNSLIKLFEYTKSNPLSEEVIKNTPQYDAILKEKVIPILLDSKDSPEKSYVKGLSPSINGQKIEWKNKKLVKSKFYETMLNILSVILGINSDIGKLWTILRRSIISQTEPKKRWKIFIPAFFILLLITGFVYLYTTPFSFSYKSLNTEYEKIKGLERINSENKEVRSWYEVTYKGFKPISYETESLLDLPPYSPIDIGMDWSNGAEYYFDSSGDISYIITYDSVGNAIQRKNYTFNRDKSSAVLTFMNPDTLQKQNALNIKTPNTFSLLSSKIDSVNMSFDDNGRTEEVAFLSNGNPSYDDNGIGGFRYAYDENGRILSVDISTIGGETTVQFRYYNDTSNIIEIRAVSNIPLFEEIYGFNVKSFSYDDAGNIIGVHSIPDNGESFNIISSFSDGDSYGIEISKSDNSRINITSTNSSITLQKDEEQPRLYSFTSKNNEFVISEYYLNDEKQRTFFNGSPIFTVKKTINPLTGLIEAIDLLDENGSPIKETPYTSIRLMYKSSGGINVSYINSNGLEIENKTIRNDELSQYTDIGDIISSLGITNSEGEKEYLLNAFDAHSSDIPFAIGYSELENEGQAIRYAATEAFGILANQGKVTVDETIISDDIFFASDAQNISDQIAYCPEIMNLNSDGKGTWLTVDSNIGSGSIEGEESKEILNEMKIKFNLEEFYPNSEIFNSNSELSTLLQSLINDKNNKITTLLDSYVNSVFNSYEEKV